MKFIDKEFLGPFDLESEDKPVTSGIYILVNKNDKHYKPLYIGRSINIKNRLNNLFSHAQLAQSGMEGVIDSFFYFPIDKDNVEEMNQLEKELIRYYEPSLNMVRSRVDPQAIIRAREVERSSSRKSFWSLSILGFTLTIFSFLVSILISNDLYTPREKIQNQIITAINNGADLRAIKHIYVNREKTSGGILKPFVSDVNVYPYNVALSLILEDIRTNAYLEKGDKSILKNINKLIEDHTHINPFDRLESVQRDYFENIQIKLGEEYGRVSIEVNKLADELYNKNSLVEQYLKDSTTSFWVSVSALLFSILVSAYQLYNGRDARVKRIMLESYSESIGKTEQ
ncbi:hypothetical protein BIY22_08895 [Vibrio panuliri]|uniref:GIY-YIG domain-containing protein n=1 Tax=Vibrio panuliri TaxID=1381081 RepID=A0A1Q9HEZ2_9VIBR|nr:GIY-YIG nuclease family protein [Vibrio panuliri]OLQ88271.1 hypothetical protein BIY22_08895 [Vibrio panuliri]